MALIAIAYSSPNLGAYVEGNGDISWGTQLLHNKQCNTGFENPVRARSSPFAPTCQPNQYTPIPTLPGHCPFPLLSLLCYFAIQLIINCDLSKNNVHKLNQPTCFRGPALNLWSRLKIFSPLMYKQHPKHKSSQ